MGRIKLFDRYQMILAIVAGASLVVSFIFFVPMYLSASFIYDEMGMLETVEYDSTLQTIYSIFSLLHATALVWFLTRIITFKMRQREELQLPQ